MGNFLDKDSDFYRLPSRLLNIAGYAVLVLGIIGTITTIVLAFDRQYEDYSLFLWGIALYLLISAIVTWTVLCLFNDIHEKLTTEPEEDWEKLFICYIIADEQGKAKDLLINKIYESDIIDMIIEKSNHRNIENLKDSLKKEFDKEFGKYFAYLDHFDFDINRIINHYKR